MIVSTDSVRRLILRILAWLFKLRQLRSCLKELRLKFEFFVILPVDLGEVVLLRNSSSLFFWRERLYFGR